MSPSRFHEPPTATLQGRSHSVCGRPPETSSFLSLPPASNATNRPSGDQNGGGAVPPVSVPGRGRTSSESMARIQSRAMPSEPTPDESQVTAVRREAEISRPREFDGRRNLEAHRAGRRRAARETCRYASGASVCQQQRSRAQPSHPPSRRGGLRGAVAVDALDASETPSSANARSLAV